MGPRVGSVVGAGGRGAAKYGGNTDRYRREYCQWGAHSWLCPHQEHLGDTGSACR